MIGGDTGAGVARRGRLSRSRRCRRREETEYATAPLGGIGEAVIIDHLGRTARIAMADVGRPATAAERMRATVIAGFGQAARAPVVVVGRTAAAAGGFVDAPVPCFEEGSAASGRLSWKTPPPERTRAVCGKSKMDPEATATPPALVTMAVQARPSTPLTPNKRPPVQLRQPLL